MDIEETFDIYFSRFFGLFFAKIGVKYGWTPTFISILSLVTGVAGGVLFLYQDDIVIMSIASILIILAGVLDSADGQLARMTNQSTELGRAIDGGIDTAVFTAVYFAGGTYYLLSIGYKLNFYSLDAFAYGFMLFATFAGYVHSHKTAIYDFYKMEYMFLVGHSKSAQIPTLDEIAEKMEQATTLLDKFLFLVLWSHASQHYTFTTRTNDIRSRFNKFSFSKEGSESDQFISSYRALNKGMLSWWALVCGTNTQRSLMVICGLLGRFEIYLIITAISVVPVAIISLAQKKRDARLLAMFETDELLKK